MANENRLIDANVVLAKKFTTGLSDASGNYYGYADVVFADDIENAPTVDAVEVVHGRWIDDGGLDEDGNDQYRCSHCGVGEKHNPTVSVSYCWNCGAKMDGDSK